MPANSTAANGVAEVDIRTADGMMDCYLAYPSGGGRHALVVLFMDVWGLRDELFALARGIAGHDYYCIVPNLFYREGKVRYARYAASGEMLSLHKLPPDDQEQIRRSGRALSRQTTRVDLAAILDFCRGQPVAAGAAGTVGYCLGGRMAFYAGQEFPDRFCANASLHGTLLVTDAPDSPHRLVDRLRGAFYSGFGERDGFGAPAIRDALARAFAGNDAVVYRANAHAGAEHGYALPDRDVYDRAAAETDWREIFAMFERQLARSA